MFIVDRMILPPERKRNNDDESITVILFKKRDVNDRDKSLKTIKILPEDTKIVICDICSASLKSQVWLDHYKKSVHRFSDKYLSGAPLYCSVMTTSVGKQGFVIIVYLSEEC